MIQTVRFQLTFHANSVVKDGIRFGYQFVVLYSHAVADASTKVYDERGAVYAFASEVRRKTLVKEMYFVYLFRHFHWLLLLLDFYRKIIRINGRLFDGLSDLSCDRTKYCQSSWQRMIHRIGTCKM